MRRFLAVLVALCITVPAVALAATDTDPKKRLTAADQAKARSIVLKRTDFAAGWKKVPPEPESGADDTCPGYNPNYSDLTLTGEAESNFEHTQGLPLISSFAEIYVTKADAEKSWARGAKPAVARCLAHFLRQGAEEDGGKLTVVSQGRIAFPKVAPRTIAFRVVARMTVPREGQTPVTVPLTVHLIGVGHGRGDVTIFTTGLGTGVQMADLRAFAALSAMRLAAAKL